MERVMARAGKIENAVQPWTLFTGHGGHRERVLQIQVIILALVPVWKLIFS
jgi:hypothetical protein